MEKVNYVQKEIDKGKLVRDQVANVIALAEKNEVRLNADDAKFLIKGLKNGHQHALNLASRINREETIRRLHQQIEYLDAHRPLKTLEKAIQDTENALNEWFEKAKADPFYQFRWADKAVEKAAALHIYKGIHFHFRDHETEECWNEIMEEIRTEAISKASYPASSTSPTSNFAETMEMKVLATIAKGDDFNLSRIDFWFRENKKVQDQVTEMNISI